MERYARQILARRTLVLCASALVTALLGLQIGHLQIVIDPDKSVPQTHPLIRATNRLEALFGNKFTALIAVTATHGDAFTPEVLAKVSRITAQVAQMEGVVPTTLLSVAARRAKRITGDADGLTVKPLLERPPRTPADLAALRRALQENPVYQGLAVSNDGRTLSVLADFKVPHGFSPIARRLSQIADAERDASVQIALGGVPIFLALLERYSARMALLFPLALLLIGAIHYHAFRTAQALVLPLVTALLAVIWSLGLMGLAGVPLDVFNASTPILILAIAAGHAVQILKRYYEEYQLARAGSPSLPPRDASRAAIVSALTNVGPVMIAAGLIAAAGFFSLAVFEIKTIQTFGIFTGLGICCALLLELTFIPALRSCLPPPGQREAGSERQDTFWDGLVRRACALVLGRRRAIYLTAAAALLALVAGAQLLRMDNSQKSLFSSGLRERLDDDQINERLAGSNAIYLLVDGGAPDAIKRPDVLRAMDEVQRHLAQEPLVGKTLSLADFVRRIHRAMNGDQPAFDRIPDDPNLIAQYLLLYSTSGDPGDFDAWVDYGYQNASVLALLKTDSTAAIDALDQRLLAFARPRFPSDVKISVGGGTTGSIALTEVMVREKLLNIAQILAVVFFVSSLLFRSPLAGALVSVPLLFTVAATFGAMGLLGIPLQIFTALTASMAVGIGADYAIYLTYRLREELQKTPGDERAAIERAFASAGKAILFVSSAVAGGYAVLVLSPGFLLHLWMGVLIAIAMLASAASALTIFPALLLTLRPRFVFAPRAAPALSLGALLLAFLGGALATSPARAEAPTAGEIMRRSFLSTRVADSDSEATFRLINAAGQERMRKVRSRTRLTAGALDNRRLVRFVSPADVKGTSTLLVEHAGGDDDLWIYLPALRKVRRLVASNKADSFVGTDFSYGDVIGHRVEDWDHKLLRQEPSGSRPCWVVESTPRTAEVASASGYSKRTEWIDVDTYVVLNANLNDSSGALVKVLEASHVEEVDKALHRFQPMQLEMRNVQSGHRTTITLERFSANVGLSEELFTPRALEQEE